MNSKIEVDTLVDLIETYRDFGLPKIEKNIKPPVRGLGKKWSNVFNAMEAGDSIVVTIKERDSILSWKWLLPIRPKIMTRRIDGDQYRVWLLDEWSKEKANDTCV